MEHNFIEFTYFNGNSAQVSYVCVHCGMWTNPDGLLLPRAKEVVFPAFFPNTHAEETYSCSYYKEESERYISEIKHLGHKWKPDRPSVLLQCEVCDVEFWLNDGAWVHISVYQAGQYRLFDRELKSCDEVIMEKTLM